MSKGTKVGGLSKGGGDPYPDFNKAYDAPSMTSPGKNDLNK